ncbi:MAG: hypothetical protein ACE5HZ_05210 [Fidelibacterota bacterium]
MNKKAVVWSILIMVAAGFTACAQEEEEEEIMGEVHVSVMFMNYTSMKEDATMVMAYAWDSSNWSSGPSGSPASNAADGMFMGKTLNPNAPDTLSGTEEVHLGDLPKGTYYVGVFETSQMAYDASDAHLIGYYDENDDNMITMDAATATGVAITQSGDVELETMMAMGGM